MSYRVGTMQSQQCIEHAMHADMNNLTVIYGKTRLIPKENASLHIHVQGHTSPGDTLHLCKTRIAMYIGLTVALVCIIASLQYYLAFYTLLEVDRGRNA